MNALSLNTQNFDNFAVCELSFEEQVGIDGGQLAPLLRELGKAIFQSAVYDASKELLTSATNAFINASPGASYTVDASGAPSN
jgi:hypothetical protein